MFSEWKRQFRIKSLKQFFAKVKLNSLQLALYLEVKSRILWISSYSLNRNKIETVEFQSMKALNRERSITVFEKYE